MSHILLIDDDLTLRPVLAMVLGRLGHTVVQAGDGDDGIACLRAVAFDLVITDLNLPGVEGIEIVGKIHRERPGAPLIVMSGDLPRSPRFSAEAAGHGVETTLAKPFNISELAAAVGRVLAGGNSLDSLHRKG